MDLGGLDWHMISYHLIDKTLMITCVVASYIFFRHYIKLFFAWWPTIVKNMDARVEEWNKKLDKKLKK